MPNLQDLRWEYRIWPSETAAPLDAVRQKGKMQQSEYRTDTYVLSKSEDLSPKLRGNRLFEVKRKCETVEGFERWGVALRKEFPLTADDLNIYPKELHGASGCADPESLETAAVKNGLLVASIRKHRSLFDIDTVQAGITEVLGGGLPMLSIALEGEDFERTKAVALDLGLTAFPNQDYSAALRAAV